MSLKDMIESKIASKDNYTLISLENELGRKLTKDENKILEEYSSDERIFPCYFIVCPNCGTNISFYFSSTKNIEQSRKCFSCKKKVNTTIKHALIVYETVSPKEKLNF